MLFHIKVKSYPVEFDRPFFWGGLNLKLFEYGLLTQARFAYMFRTEVKILVHFTTPVME